MRILFLNQAPKSGGNKKKPHYESGAVEEVGWIALLTRR